MSHVDEGELTAYADGAWAPHQADAQRIAAHLAECGNCRNRLAQAQSLSARASEILAVASPAHVTVPPFEQVRAEAVPRKQWTAPPMAWAATVILALGIGWFGRGAVPRVDTRAAAMEQSTESVTISPQQDAVPISPIGETSAAAPIVSPARSIASGPAVRTKGSSGTGAATPDMVGQVAAAPSVESSVRDQSVAEENAAARVPRDQVAGKAMAAPAAPPPAAAQAGNSAAFEQRAAATLRATGAAQPKKQVAVEHITIAEAERRGIELHLVPELEVLRVGIAENSVITEQKLGDGKLLTITQTTVNTRERDGAVGPVYVMRNGIRVMVAGPVARDSLRALAEKIR